MTGEIKPPGGVYRASKQLTEEYLEGLPDTAYGIATVSFPDERNSDHLVEPRYSPQVSNSIGRRELLTILQLGLTDN